VPIIRKILTVHSPIGPSVVDELLTSIEGALHRVGASRVWIDPQSTHDLTVMAELPDSSELPKGAELLDADVPDPRSIDDEALRASDAALA
jgi:hypothetical protein